MANPLFARILPKEAAARGQLFEIKEKVGEFDRLVEIVEADIAAVSRNSQPQNWRDMPVAIRLEFAWADGMEGVPVIHGRVSAQLPATCQRCMTAFNMLLDSSVNMVIVTPAKLADVERYEVWELEDEDFRLVDVVEEVLIMAMPLAPTHETGESCTAVTIEDADSGSETVRPFADLKSQMEKTND